MTTGAEAAETNVVAATGVGETRTIDCMPCIREVGVRGMHTHGSEVGKGEPSAEFSHLLTADLEELPTSSIVGAIKITGSSPPPEPKVNEWHIGPICNWIGDTVRFTTPIPAKGFLGAWSLGDLTTQVQVAFRAGGDIGTFRRPDYCGVRL
jgi:hypothetical protein